MHPSGSFTVEKCFTSSNIPMRETIASEVLNVQPELSKTKHGPYLLRKLDIEGKALYPFFLLSLDLFLLKNFLGIDYFFVIVYSY